MADPLTRDPLTDIPAWMLRLSPEDAASAARWRLRRCLAGRTEHRCQGYNTEIWTQAARLWLRTVRATAARIAGRG